MAHPLSSTIVNYDADLLIAILDVDILILQGEREFRTTYIKINKLLLILIHDLLGLDIINNECVCFLNNFLLISIIT